MIQFDPDTYQVSYAGESLPLLPKEFALLRYLYEHAGRSFSREALLDAVWPLEAPTDRTVDDHIYRLRKKTARWPHLLSIETVRGQGYKLTRRDRTSAISPLLQDEQFASDVKRMLAKYHGLGMGAALQLLAANKATLGLPSDPYYDVYVHFVRGDFEWLLRSDGLEDWLKAAYAVFIHASIQPDPGRSLPYFEKLIARGESIPIDWLCDLRLNAISLYLELGRFQEARSELEAIRQPIRDMDSPSFASHFLLKEMQLLLLEGHRDAAEAKLRECDELLAEHPIQRERGAYQASKAIFLYEKGEAEAARQAAGEAIETLRQTSFAPHLIASVNMLLRYLETRGRDDLYRADCRRLWEQLSEQYGFGRLLRLSESLLGRLL
jgi:Response regulators consisting of a CheY-like receiver domain and a winged-helix DNA-binding domain